MGACRFWRALRGQEFAIVHQHYGNRAVRWLARKSTPAGRIVHLHTRVFEPRGSAPVLAEVVDADAVIAVSAAVAHQVRGLQPQVVYPGVATPGPLPARRGPSHVIGTACRLAPIKGLTYLIRALAIVRRRIPEIRLEIAGSGPEQPALEEEIRTLGLRDSVSFLGWQKDLFTPLRTWDVFALPSLDEGLPIAAIEAMASGLPVVASAVGGLPELVIDGATGYLVPSRDPEVLAERLAALLLNPDLRRTMGAAGHARARQHFSEEQMVSAVSDVYDKLAGLG
jgi:glycosyltransferase involved in cell wall biosynthesis